MAKQVVQPGQRYRARKAWAYVWVVESVSADSSTVPHARLHALDDPTERRTFSCSVLLDPDRFELIQDAPAYDDYYEQ